MTERELGNISSLRLLKVLLTLDLSEDLRNKYADYLMDNPAFSEHDADFEKNIRDFVKNTTFVRLVFASEIRQGAPCYEIFIPLTKEQLSNKVADYAFECKCTMEELESLENNGTNNTLTVEDISALLSNRVSVEDWLTAINAISLMKTIAEDVTIAEIKNEWPIEFLELLRYEILKLIK